MLWGFCLDYTAVMGSLVVFGAPILQSYKTELLWILVSGVVVGTLAILVGKLSRVDETY